MTDTSAPATRTGRGQGPRFLLGAQVEVALQQEARSHVRALKGGVKRALHRSTGAGPAGGGPGCRRGPPGAHQIDRPTDLDVVRESYDRVADNYPGLVRVRRSARNFTATAGWMPRNSPAGATCCAGRPGLVHFTSQTRPG